MDERIEKYFLEYSIIQCIRNETLCWEPCLVPGSVI